MLNILLLEPNPMLGRQYASFLRSHGCTTQLCAHAQDAISQADKNKPDIVVMEILLAGHSGIEFMHEFRSYPEWRSIPVLILSRLPKRQVVADSKILESLGIAAYLYKPETSLEKLLTHIERYGVVASRYS